MILHRCNKCRFLIEHGFIFYEIKYRKCDYVHPDTAHLCVKCFEDFFKPTCTVCGKPHGEKEICPEVAG